MFGILTFEEPTSRRSGRVVWLCTCECGNRTESVWGTAKSCGCLNHKEKADSHNWSGYKGISGRRWSGIMGDASKRGIDFKISKKQAWKRYQKQDGKCAYTGEDIPFDSSASLDRIDSDIGYSEENIQWVHKIINRMKWTLSENGFLMMVGLVCNPLSGEMKRRDSVKNPKWAGVGDLPNWAVGRLINVASRRGIVFSPEVDAQYLWGLYVSQNGRCALTGIPIYFPENSYKRKFATASLDRIDSDCGYEFGNLQWLHKNVNNMKNSMTREEFIKTCHRIEKHKTRR